MWNYGGLVTVNGSVFTFGELLKLVYYFMIMCNGWIELGAKVLWKLVNQGILHTTNHSDFTKEVERVKFEEPMMEIAIKEVRELLFN
jgi:hypothetical protein